MINSHVDAQLISHVLAEDGDDEMKKSKQGSHSIDKATYSLQTETMG